MIQTVEATVDTEGKVALRRPIRLASSRRAILIVLDEEPAPEVPETAFLSEQALAEDSSRAEGDASHGRTQAKCAMAEAAQRMARYYAADRELTAFSALDGEDVCE